jgi:hypothetical protein
MKKMITISALALSLSLSAQHAIPQHQQVFTKNIASLSNLKTSGTTTDTLRPASLSKGGCGVSTATATAGQYIIYYYTIDDVAPIDTGYLFGSNILGINEVAQKYTVTGTASVSDVMFIANAASSSGTTTKVISNIYSQDATTKGPGTVLGTASKPLINISADSYNTISYTTAVVVDNSTFFATILSPPLGGATKDTLALLTTAYGCTSADSLAWIKTPSQWYSMKTFFGTPKDAVDFVIFPVVTVPSSAGINSVTKENLSLLAAYPNPANTNININFSLSEPSKADVEIYDLTGKLIIAVKGTNSFAEGKHIIPIDINSLASGSYFYSINTDKAKIFSKFSVVK